MAGSKLTDKNIKGLASENSFRRGKEYFHGGTVSELVQRGETLTAEVEGSEYFPYEIKVQLHQGGIADASCSCPYEWGGYCKHIVAVLLSYTKTPEAVKKREPVVEKLKELDAPQLLSLLTRLSESVPRLEDRIEAELAIIMATAGSPTPSPPPAERRTLVDPDPIRNQARKILGSPDWPGGFRDEYRYSGRLDDIGKLMDSAAPFLEAGDGQNALRILEPIASTLVRDGLHIYYYDEDIYHHFNNLGTLMAEAILSAYLSVDERQKWQETLRAWQRQLDEYGIEDALWVAIRAAERGWDDPGLMAALEGKARKNSWKEDDRWTGDEMTSIRLRVLEHEGRIEAYLELALASGFRTEYALMLVRLGKTDEAVVFGLRDFKRPDEALDLAMTLRELGAVQQALKVAESGLGLTGRINKFQESSVIPLARWLGDFAAGLGDSELALRSARKAYEDSLSLNDYQSVEHWAGENWPKIRPDLLQLLKSRNLAPDRTRIYLYENMVNEAVQSVGKSSRESAFDDILMQVAAAAYASHPEWVIKVSRKQAEWIMDSGMAKAYDLAAKWLEKTKLAHLAANMPSQWSDYLEKQIENHKRKYKMRPLLEKMR